MRAAALLAVGILGCHITTDLPVVRAGARHHERRDKDAVARPATLIVADDGRLRFVEPLDCPSDDVIEQQEIVTTQVRPNLATFVVAVIVTAAGGILTVRGAADSNAALTGLGVGGVVAGLPFAIGPFLGSRDIDRAGSPQPPVRYPGTTEPCGERAMEATAAVLDLRGIEVRGTVDKDGYYSISPYTFVDAFQPTAVTAWEVRAAVETPKGEKVISAVLDNRALEAGAKVFLAHPDFDATIEPIHLVPNVTATQPSITLTTLDDGTPAARVVIGLQNAGPGDAFALRGTIETPIRALDGRVIYVGRLDKNKQVVKELLIPLTVSSASALKHATIDLAIVLGDAHGTAPAAPIRFHGTIP